MIDDVTMDVNNKSLLKLFMVLLYSLDKQGVLKTSEFCDDLEDVLLANRLSGNIGTDDSELLLNVLRVLSK